MSSNYYAPDMAPPTGPEFNPYGPAMPGAPRGTLGGIGSLPTTGGGKPGMPLNTTTSTQSMPHGGMNPGMTPPQMNIGQPQAAGGVPTDDEVRAYKASMGWTGADLNTDLDAYRNQMRIANENGGQIPTDRAYWLNQAQQAGNPAQFAQDAMRGALTSGTALGGGPNMGTGLAGLPVGAMTNDQATTAMMGGLAPGEQMKPQLGYEPNQTPFDDTPMYPGGSRDFNENPRDQPQGYTATPGSTPGGGNIPGGSVTNTLTSTGTGSPGVGGDGTGSPLAQWSGGYVTDMLGRAQALAGQPYAMYGGNLTAGESDLQSRAFDGIANLALPSEGRGNFAANTFSTRLPGTSEQDPYGVASMESLMNPYVKNVVDPQVREAQRQAEIDRINNASRMTKAGSFGGSRQAILEAERQRNLGTQVGDIVGKGYASAYDNAQSQQFKNAQLGMDAQKASEQSRQFGANYGLEKDRFGLSALDQMLKAGGTQRDIEQQGLTADRAEFERQRDYPKEQLQFMQSMLQGLPISTSGMPAATPEPSKLQNVVGGLTGLTSLYQALRGIGL